MLTGTVMEIMDTHFPNPPGRREEGVATLVLDVPEFLEEKLVAATSEMRNNKALRPDGAPVEVLKVVVGSPHILLLRMFNVYVLVGVFTITLEDS